MKQEILCQDCKDERRTRQPSDNPYPGEHVKYLLGLAKMNYRCDLCDATILKDSLCWAYSLWADHSPAPYYSWEAKYINDVSSDPG